MKTQVSVNSAVIRAEDPHIFAFQQQACSNYSPLDLIGLCKDISKLFSLMILHVEV